MGILVSRGYVNSNFSLKPGGTADTDAYLIAYISWITTNYWCSVSGNQDANRCPSSDELSVTERILSLQVEPDWPVDYGTYVEVSWNPYRNVNLGTISPISITYTNYANSGNTIGNVSISDPWYSASSLESIQVNYQKNYAGYTAYCTFTNNPPYAGYTVGVTASCYISPLPATTTTTTPAPTTTTTTTPAPTTTTTTTVVLAQITIVNTSIFSTITQITVNSIETTGDSYDSLATRFTDQIGTYTVRIYISEPGDNGGNVTIIDYTCQDYTGTTMRTFTSVDVNTTTPLIVSVEDGSCA